MAVVIDDTEHQAAESGAVDSFAIRGMRALPAARIALVRRLRADLLRVQRRDYFPPVERDAAGTAVDILAASVLEPEEQSS